MGGPMAQVIWSGTIAIVVLMAFVASIEGYLFARITLIPRVLLAASMIGIFYPSFMTEVVGFVAILLLLGGNWVAGRRENSAAGVGTA